ncbi:MAG: glycosyltransferase family 4 protein [Verrucomicrobiales bacterium]
MKILHTEWSHGWGGQEIRIISEMEAFRDRGYTMSIACHPDSQIFTEATKRGFEVFSVSFGSPANLAVIAKTAKLARSLGVDLIHTHSSKDSWIGGIAGKVTGIPVVRSRHISALIKPKPTNRILYGYLPSAIVTSGSVIAQQLIEATSVPEEKVFSVAPGADPERFKPNLEFRRETREKYGIEEDALVFGMIAVLRSWKGHCLFLEAIKPAMDEDPSIRVLIVGEGPIRGEIEEKIEQLSIQSQVILTGYQSEPEKFFPAMDVHLLPSLRNEGAPQAVPQAMMCGVANITSDGGGLSDVIEHEVSGLVARAGSLEELRSCVERLVQDQKLRVSLASTGKEVATNRFTFAKQMEQTETAYRFALKP